MTDELFNAVKIKNLQFINIGFNKFTEQKLREVEKKGVVVLREERMLWWNSMEKIKYEKKLNNSINI